jgi:hypothetical protein
MKVKKAKRAHPDRGVTREEVRAHFHNARMATKLLKKLVKAGR